jgi:ABC-type amino acid transport substrate-binding protein
MNRCAAVLAGLVLGCFLAAPARADAVPLTICINEDAAPYSVAHGDAVSGFDVAVAQALARRMGRPLVIQWFETKLSDDSSSSLEANALLSDGRCELLAGYPLLRDALGKPGFDSARLPGFRGNKPADRRRRVPTGTLVPTQPYHRATIVVALGPAARARHVGSLGDLAGLKIGVQGGTLADAILMGYNKGQFIDQIEHFRPEPGEFLEHMERGDFDATLIMLHRFDSYIAQHPNTRIVVSGYTYPAGVNLGFVTLSTQSALVQEVNVAIAEMLAKNEFSAIAKASGMTYIAPREPAVVEALKISDLAK